MTVSDLVYLPFPKETIGPGKIYRSSLPKVDELEYLKNELKIQTIVRLCEEREFHYSSNKKTLRKYKQLHFSVIKYPIPDFSPPSDKSKTLALIDEILHVAKQGDNILIHCIGGNGRTGLILSILARKVFGFDGQEAIHWVRSYVPYAVEDFQQEAFVLTCFPEDEQPAIERHKIKLTDSSL